MITSKISISNIIGARRLDVSYFLNVKHFGGYVSLSKYVEIKGGKRIPKGESFSCDETDSLYLRLSDINDFESLNYDDFKYISDKLYQTLSRYEIKEGELAISIAGTIGKLFIVKDIPSGKKVVLTENCAKILMRNTDVLPEYIKILLSQDFVQDQINANRIKTTIPKLGLDRIGKLQIPEVPNIPMQQYIIDLYQKAQDAKQAKEAEAKTLLASVDTEILEQLGIIIPKVKQKQVICNINIANLMGCRLDPYYYNIDFKHILGCIENSIYQCLPIGDLTSLLASGKTPAASEYASEVSDFPIIKAGSYTNSSIDLDKTGYCKKEQSVFACKDDIFILSAAHQAEYVGKQIKILEDIPIVRTSYVGELICVRANSLCNPVYLFSLLSTPLFKTLLNREKRGQTSHIYPSDIKEIKIPVPPMKIQRDIANEITIKKTKAKQLQQEGAALLKEANEQIEKIILG